MSHIYDALSKQKAQAKTPAAGVAPPPAPVAASTTPLPDPVDPIRDRELDALRQRILLELSLDHSPTIVFTGAVPGEGATTLALHFARGLAEVEQRPVLLVDGDFARSRSSLTGALGPAGDGAPGFGEILAGKAELAGTVLGTEHPLLHFLPSGQLTVPILDLARSEAVVRALRDLGRHYAFVIIDAGPSLEAAETGPLSAATDGVVLVVRANRIRREIVQKAVHHLNKARCHVLGIVLNDRRFPIPEFLYRRI
jgi:Mrp family chromosome partitioning ATPase